MKVALANEDSSFESKVAHTENKVSSESLEDFVKIARAKGDVNSRIAAIGLWNSKSSEDRTAYISQNRDSVNVEKTQLTQCGLESYKTKIDTLYAKLSGMVLKGGETPSVNQLVPHLTLIERVRYEGLRAADGIAQIAGQKTEYSQTYAEGQRKTITFRRIEHIIGEYQTAINENNSEFKRARVKKQTLEQERDSLYNQLLKNADEFESCEKYLVSMKKQLEHAKEIHKQGERNGNDIGACTREDLEPTKKRYDQLAGDIKHTWMFLQYTKRNYASVAMAAHVLDQLDTRLNADQKLLKGFHSRQNADININVHLRGLELIKTYNGFSAGIAEFSNGQDLANVDLANLDISPGAAFATSDQAHCEEIANALESINGEVRNSVREIIDKTRREAYGL